MKFEYTKHKALWQYMAERATIMKIVDIINNLFDDDNINKYENYNTVKDEVDHTIGSIKRKYINNAYHEEVICSCYACKASEQTCYKCRIKIGRCYEQDSYFGKYIKAITDYIVIGGNEYIEKAHEYAINIAMAGINGDVIVAYNLEVK